MACRISSKNCEVFKKQNTGKTQNFSMKFKDAYPNLLAAPARHRIEGGMTPSAVQWLWLVVFYLVGSIPTGYLMGRARGIDIRQHGSGNIGATNTGRVLGRNWGLVAFACDFLKGFLPLYLLRKLSFAEG